MPDPRVRVILTFRTPTSAARVLECVLTAIRTERRAGRPIPKLAVSSAPPPPHDPDVSISLTFRTPAPSDVVLENVLAAIDSVPYELTGTLCTSFDLDDVED